MSAPSVHAKSALDRGYETHGIEKLTPFGLRITASEAVISPEGVST
ncbi:MAG: hypothetical protein ACRYFS_05445 [Janthinobacterium lividum]